MRIIGWALTVIVALVAGPVLAIPARVDTTAFDGPKSTATLANGQTLAWVELGDPKGRPVLKIDRADIVGHSLGSIVAQTFAELWPDRTGKVVLIASTAGRAPGEAGGLDFVTPILALQDPIDPNSPFMRAWWSSPTPVDEAFLTRQREDSATIPAAVWKAVIFQGLMGLELRSTLPLLKAPTLMIWGDQDPIITASDRAGLIAGLPDARVKVYPGLGHNPFWEQPARVADDIEAFLTE
jgi:pimeloyl-ACP methyl ester carboxylesterase